MNFALNHQKSKKRKFQNSLLQKFVISVGIEYALSRLCQLFGWPTVGFGFYKLMDWRIYFASEPPDKLQFTIQK